MFQTIELLVKLGEAKSAAINSVGHSTHNRRLRYAELYTALDLTNTEHELGMLIIKSMYLDNDTHSKYKLLKLIETYCQSAGFMHEDIVAIIIMQILLDKPLITQQEKIKWLYKRYGAEAARSQSEQSKNQKLLDELYDDGYRADQLKDIIQYEKDKLNNYAENKAKTTIRCAKCDGHGCKLCTGGDIKATMDDALQLFAKLEIHFTPRDFLDRYWKPILSIVSKLEAQKTEAHNKMNLEYSKIKETV